jgi:hypothetical protein
MKTVEESMLSLLPNGKNVSFQYRLLLFGYLLRADPRPVWRVCRRMGR